MIMSHGLIDNVECVLATVCGGGVDASKTAQQLMQHLDVKKVVVNHHHLQSLHVVFNHAIWLLLWWWHDGSW